MSLSHEVTVWCDGDECGQWDQACGTAKQLRRELKAKGWTSEGPKDYCPSCSEKRKEESC